jgi:hypothetical protein
VHHSPLDRVDLVIPRLVQLRVGGPFAGNVLSATSKTGDEEGSRRVAPPNRLNRPIQSTSQRPSTSDRPLVMRCMEQHTRGLGHLFNQAPVSRPRRSARLPFPFRRDNIGIANLQQACEGWRWPARWAAR